MTLSFPESYLGQLRTLVGNRILQVPGFRAVLENPACEILLQLRSDFKIWGLPGGHPEEGESIKNCILREVQEETGLELLDFNCFGFSSDPSSEVSTYPNGHMIHSFPILVYSNHWKGTLAQSTEESLALKFFNRKELPEMLKNEHASLELYGAYKRTGAFQLT